MERGPTVNSGWRVRGGSASVFLAHGLYLRVLVDEIILLLLGLVLGYIFLRGVLLVRQLFALSLLRLLRVYDLGGGLRLICAVGVFQRIVMGLLEENIYDVIVVGEKLFL